MREMARRSRLIMGVSPGEFLVVAAVAGILGALAMREAMTAFPRVKQTELLGLAIHAKVHWAETWANDGVLPDATPLVDDKDGTYVFPIDGDSAGTANFALGEKFGDLEGEIVSIRPAFPAGESRTAIVWVCGNAPAPRGFEVRGENRTSVPPSKLMAACRVRT
jgi:hypothetical protein